MKIKGDLSAAYQVWFAEYIDINDAKLTHNPEDSIINFLSLSEKARGLMATIMHMNKPPQSKTGLVNLAKKQMHVGHVRATEVVNEIYQMGMY